MKVHLYFGLHALILFLNLMTEASAVPKSKDAHSIEQNLKEANAYYGKGNLDQALQLYMKCLQEDPNQPDCLCNIGSVLLDAGKVDDAKIHYRRALKVTEGNHAGALYNLALLLQDGLKEGDLIESRHLYLRLVGIETKNEEAWANLGAVQHQLGDLRVAIQSYMKAVELYSLKNTEGEHNLVMSTLHENVGRVTLRLAERITDNAVNRDAVTAKALEFLQAAVSFNPSNEVSCFKKFADVSLSV